MEKELLKFLENNKEVKVSDLVKFFKKDRTTIYRWLKKLGYCYYKIDRT